MLRFLFLWILSAVPAFCLVQETTATGMPAVSVSIGQWLLSCITVIGLMFAMVWFLKKTRIMPGGRHGVMQVVSTMSVSSHERIMIVRTGDRYFLLGVTAHNISCLAEISSEDVEKYTVSPSSEVRGSFASRLVDALKCRDPAGEKTDPEKDLSEAKGGVHDKRD